MYRYIIFLYSLHRFRPYRGQYIDLQHDNYTTLRTIIHQHETEFENDVGGSGQDDDEKHTNSKTDSRRVRLAVCSGVVFEDGCMVL